MIVVYVLKDDVFEFAFIGDTFLDERYQALFLVDLGNHAVKWGSIEDE